MLVVLGDSHSVIWEGHNITESDNAHDQGRKSRFEEVRSYHLGPALAYNLMSSDGKDIGKWGELVFNALDRQAQENPNISSIMLSFGEIDLRTQIVKRAVAQNKSLYDSVDAVVERLIHFSELLYHKTGVPILIWEPVATTSARHFSYNPQLPTVGSEIERNYATKLFSEIARMRSAECRALNKQIFSFGIYDEITSFHYTKPEFYEDGCHLNFKGFQIALDAFRNLVSEQNLSFISDVYESFRAISQVSKLRNMTPDAKVILSSEEVAPSSLAPHSRGFCFHTKKDNRPHAVIELPYAAMLTKLVIFNRSDGFFDRSRSMWVLAGVDFEKLNILHMSEGTWGADGAPLIIHFSDEGRPIRFIVLQLQQSDFFHLGEVQIWEKSYLRM